MENSIRKRIITIAILVLIVLILGFLIWLFMPPFDPSGLGLSLYTINNARMTSCQSVSLCDASEITTFSSSDDICVAWTDKERTYRDHLFIRIYNADTDIEVFNEFDPGSYGTKCRQTRIPSSSVNVFSQGNYRTEFYRPVIRGYKISTQHLNTVYWTIAP